MGFRRFLGSCLCAALCLIVALSGAYANPTVVDFGDSEIVIQNANVMASVTIDGSILDENSTYFYDLSTHNNESLYITIDTTLSDQTNQAIQYKYHFRMATHWELGDDSGDGGYDQINNANYPGWDTTPILGSPISDELLVDYGGPAGLFVTVFVTAEVWENTNPAHHDSDAGVFYVEFVE